MLRFERHTNERWRTRAGTGSPIPQNSLNIDSTLDDLKYCLSKGATYRNKQGFHIQLLIDCTPCGSSTEFTGHFFVFFEAWTQPLPPNETAAATVTTDHSLVVLVPLSLPSCRLGPCQSFFSAGCIKAPKVFHSLLCVRKKLLQSTERAMVIRTKVMTENDDSSLESTLQAAATTTNNNNNTKSSRRTSWSKKRRDTTVVVFVTPPSKPQPSKPKQHRTTKEQSSSQSSVTTGSSSSSSQTSSSTSSTSNGPFLQRLKSKLKKKPDPHGRKSQPAVPDDVEPATTTTTTTPPTAPRRQQGVRFSEDVQWIAPCRFRQYLTCAEIQEQWYASPDFVRFKQEARVWAGQSSLYEDYYDLDYSEDLTSGICYHYMMGHDLPDSAPATAATDSSWFPLVFSSSSTQTNDDNQKDEMTTAMDQAVETCLSVPCTASHDWWVPLLTADSSSSSSSSTPPTESHAMLPVPS